MSILVCSACAVHKHTINQGISGDVRWVEGNLMPALGDTTYLDRSKGIPVAREIYIFKAIKIHDVKPQIGDFYSDIKSELIKRVKTDKNGKFTVMLPPGKYSVFVMEKEGFFANKYDGEGYINPVIVVAGEFAEMNITINYKAYY